MLTKRNILTVSLILTLCVAVSTGLQGLAHHTACTSASCEKVHASSFGSLFGIPLGLWAIPGLLLVTVFHLKKRTTVVSCALAAMLGAEIYLTFVQLYFIRALCLLCFCFLALLLLSFLLALHKAILERAVLITCLFFFCSHFFFFFPNMEPRCTLPQFPADSRVEVFGSPSCFHCKEAIAQLKGICSDYGADLVLRPVPLSQADYGPTLDWVCSLFFEKKTGCAKRLGLRIVQRNEKSLSEIAPHDETEAVSLPVIRVKTPQGTRLFKGWHEGFSEGIYELLENRVAVDFSVGRNLAGDVTGKGCAMEICKE